MSAISEAPPTTSQSELLAHPVHQKVATYWARRLAKSPGFRPSEFQDIRGDLLLGLAERMLGYDPAKSNLLTFSHACMRCAAISLVRSRRAAKRGRQSAARNFSDLPPGPCGRPRMPEQSNGARARIHRGVEARDAIEDLEVRRSIEQVAERLDDRQRLLVRSVMENPDADLPRILGVSATQVKRMLRAMAPEFERGGLGKSQPRCPRRRRIA